MKFRYLIGFIIVAFIVYKWPNWSFPDCENDVNLAHLKGSIARQMTVPVDKVILSEIKETGISDDGLTTNRFHCYCSVNYNVGYRKGTIHYSVTRDGDDYSTRILDKSKSYSERVLRKNEKENTSDTIRAINYLIKSPLYKNPKEYLKFFQDRPKLDSIYSIYHDGRYQKYTLTSLIQLNDRNIPFDSQEAVENFKKYNVLFDFRKEDEILLFVGMPDLLLFSTRRSYSFEIVNQYRIDNNGNMQSLKLIECGRSFELNGSKDALVVFLLNSKNTEEFSDEYIEYLWEARLMTDIGAIYRYSLIEMNPSSMNCTVNEIM